MLVSVLTMDIEYPLLDLYLLLEADGSLDSYKLVVTEFSQLWGIHIHLIGYDLFTYSYLEELLQHTRKYTFNSVAIDWGIQQRNLEDSILVTVNIPLLKLAGVTAILVPISASLMKSNLYEAFILNAIQSKMPLEVSWKVDSANLNQLSEIISFCLANKIQRCVVEAERHPLDSKLRIAGTAYKRLAQEIVETNKSLSTQGLSLAMGDCPYLGLLQTTPKTILGGCSAGIVACSVGEKGNILPCFELQDFVMGNINRDSLINVWQTSKMFAQLRDRTNLVGACGACAFKNCCGGCRADAWQSGQSLLGTDTVCWLTNKTEEIQNAWAY